MSPSSAPAFPACVPLASSRTPLVRSSCSRPAIASAAGCSTPRSATASRSISVASGSAPITRECRGLRASSGSGSFPSTAGRNLLDVAGKRRRYRGTIPRLGPGVLWDVFLARRRIARLARGVGPERPWAAERAAELDDQTLAEWCEANVRTPIARQLIGLAGRTVWGAGPEELSMLHVLFYVSAAGSFDKLIDTEGGAQQDRLDGGAQALALGLAASLGERVLLGAAVERIEQSDAGVRI